MPPQQGAIGPAGPPDPSPAVAAVQPTAYIIGPFRLDRAADVLMHGEAALSLGRRPVALLRALVERPNEIVSKDELFIRAWPGLAVEDSNLAVQISALRRALSVVPGADAWIETLPRRGYRFIGPLEPYYSPPRPTALIARFPEPGEAGASDDSADPLLRPAELPRIAILPFRSLDADSSQIWLCDGIVEEVIVALSSLRVLTIIARNSTLSYRGQDIDARRVGTDLDVRYVVTGSVLRTGDQLRISVELANCLSNSVLWARTYTPTIEEIFAVQDGIATLIVTTVVPQIEAAELARLRQKHPSRFDAYELVLRARELLFRLMQPDSSSAILDQAGTTLRRAIELDPGYATAYSLLAEWHSIRIGQGWSPDHDADARMADELAREALVRDGGHAFALAQYGHTRSYLFRDYPRAIELFDRALDLSPSNAFAWAKSSLTFSYIERPDEAIRRVRRAMNIDPLDPFAHTSYGALSMAHYVAGEYEEAVSWGYLALKKAPRYTAFHRMTAIALVALGRIREAEDVVTQMLMIEPAFRLGPYVERLPWADPRRKQVMREQLALAGLPGGSLE